MTQPARNAVCRRRFRFGPAGTGRSIVATVSARAFPSAWVNARPWPKRHGMNGRSTEPVAWGGDCVRYIDQRLLPHDVRVAEAKTVEDIHNAIASLAVRGAPCIGIFAAYGIALLRNTLHGDDFSRAAARVREARPTAVNLAWAVDRVMKSEDALAEARLIHDEQRAMDRSIAENALELFPRAATVLTHCNTGPLATAGHGTALGAIIHAARAGRKMHVYVDETRPLLQGARLTAYELDNAGVDSTLIVDAAAAVTMQRKNVDLVMVGADRIARNGDTANKIGTYALAILAAHHGIPFYVAAPRSTFDFALNDGIAIHIEERASGEVESFAGMRTTAPGGAAYNPAFDVTPGHLVTAFVTEYGIFRPPYAEALEDLSYRPRFLLPEHIS